MPTPPQNTLAGQRIIVTRPAAQAEGLCRAIAAGGGSALRLPLQAIAALDSAPALAAALNQAPHWAIFTSPNAVQQALTQVPQTARWPSQIAAVGAASAQALAHAGLAVSLPPAAPYTSESLLQQFAGLPMQGQRCLLINGRGGRRTLSTGLRQQGAKVQRLAVYQRLPLQAPQMPAVLQQADAIIITSGEGLLQLLKLNRGSALQRLQRLRLVVPSQRVLKIALDQGFSAAIEVAKPMSEAGIMQALGRVLNRESTHVG